MMYEYKVIDVKTRHWNPIYARTFREAVEKYVSRYYGDAYWMTYKTARIRVERPQDGKAMDFEVSAPKDVYVLVTTSLLFTQKGIKND